MAIISQMNNDTTASAPKSISVQDVAWKTDWNVVENRGNVTTLTNVNVGLAVPNRARFERAAIQNIYAGSGISPTHYGPSKDGVKLFSQVTSIASIADENSNNLLLLPFSGSVTLRIPKYMSSYFDATMQQSMYQQLFGLLFAQGSSDWSGLKAFLHGSTNPQNW